MLIPLMVALIPKLFCSQRLADYVELRETSACPPINYNFPGFAEMLILLHFQCFLKDSNQLYPFNINYILPGFPKMLILLHVPRFLKDAG